MDLIILGEWLKEFFSSFFLVFLFVLYNFV